MRLFQHKHVQVDRLKYISCYLFVLILVTVLMIANFNQIPYINHDTLAKVEGQDIAEDSVVQSCDTINLAIVCGGFDSTREFYVLLKSILFHRTSIINFHIFVDNISYTILSELFRTWTIRDFQYTFYNMTNYEQEISWIPSQHYSHRYGLMKLVFMSVLCEHPNASKIAEVILLDTDMLALGNIDKIMVRYLHMQKKSPEAFIGLVENLSDWYLLNESLPGGRIAWPAIGRGFNSGLMVIDLARMRTRNWRKMWTEVAELELISHLSTSLADQDVINAVAKTHSEIVYSLPCSFNLQLNDHVDLKRMCLIGVGARRDIVLAHWNTPHKFETRNSEGLNFKNQYLTFRNWDGNLLTSNVCTYNLPEVSDFGGSNPQGENICLDIRPHTNESLRTFLYFMEFELTNVTDYDVTNVVHLSIDRLRVLDELAAHWPGPISAAIYLSESETNLLLVSIQNGKNLANRKNIGYHLAFRDHGFNYPINRLRNIALNNAQTPFVFLSDIDFLPSLNLYEYLQRTVKDQFSTNSRGKSALSKRALVVPAFENVQYKFEFPTSKTELETQLNLGSVSMFRSQIWPRGHAPTDYTKWTASTKYYKVDWQPEYEPFIVTSREEVPRFDERFVGFGWNKVEHITLLAALNYDFLVLPEAFMIHQFHSASYDIVKHRESHKYRACIKQLKRTFLLELKKKFPKFFARMSYQMTATSQIIRLDPQSTTESESSIA